MVILPRLAVGLLLGLAAPSVGFPGRMNTARLTACAGGNCNIGGPHAGAQQGNAVTVTGKQDGGTYTPGETLNFAIQGNGQSRFVGVVDGNNVIDGGEDATGTITAPQTGELVLMGFVAGGAAAAVT